MLQIRARASARSPSRAVWPGAAGCRRLQAADAAPATSRRCPPGVPARELRDARAVDQCDVEALPAAADVDTAPRTCGPLGVESVTVPPKGSAGVTSARRTGFRPAGRDTRCDDRRRAHGR